MSEAINDMHAFTHLSDRVFYAILASTGPELEEVGIFWGLFLKVVCVLILVETYLHELTLALQHQVNTWSLVLFPAFGSLDIGQTC